MRLLFFEIRKHTVCIGRKLKVQKVFWDFPGICSIANSSAIGENESFLLRKVKFEIVLSNLNCQFGSAILSLEIVILKLL